MPSVCRCPRRLLAALLVVSFVPATAFAQDRNGLKIPTIAASAAAAADWASTYHALKYYKVQEQNPFLRPFQETPGSMVSLGAVMDAGAFSAWNLTVGRRNPRMAAAGLWAMAAFRGYLAIHNMRNTTKAERRERR
jgi:cytochrome bd-type quinol oxidase subunit 1